MSGSVVDFDQRRQASSSNGHRCETIPKPPLMLPHVHAWNVDLMGMFCSQCDPVPARANVRWLIRVDPQRRMYEIGVFLEGWDPCYVFQERFLPDETREQCIAREARLRLVNDLLAMSFGVPA